MKRTSVLLLVALASAVTAGCNKGKEPAAPPPVE